MNLDDFLDIFNWASRVEGLVSSVLHFDKRRASEGPPVIGLATELALSATGMASWTFRVRRDQGWTGGDVERLLNHYAIPIWCRRVTGQNFILSVPSRQANWAEYLILRRGMTLDGRLFNPDNSPLRAEVCARRSASSLGGPRSRAARHCRPARRSALGC